MASLHMLKCSMSAFSISQSNSPGKSDSRKRFFKFRNCGGSSRKCFETQKITVRCSAQEGDNQNNGEESPESLFMKELKRRGMTPTSLLEDSNSSNHGLEDEMRRGKEDQGISKRNVVSTEFDKNLSTQRERSMMMNSEGLEGLVPRAKLLLTIGGTFFLAFWPLILITTALFLALYFYFGPNFVHDGTDPPFSQQYVDPYALLEDERISQMAPTLK